MRPRGTPRHQIRKEARGSIWAENALPWGFLCRRCGRSWHHPSWDRAAVQSARHTCRSSLGW